jgi:hypothetical protein
LAPFYSYPERRAIFKKVFIAYDTRVDVMITSFSDIQQFYVGEKIGIFLKKQKLAIV